jgi:hypothetical protein
MRNTAAVMEAADTWYWSEKHALPALFHPLANPMPVALKDAVKAFDAGYNKGLHEHMEKERKKGSK